MDPIFVSQDFITKDFQNAHLARFYIPDGLDRSDNDIIISAIHTDLFINENEIEIAKQYPDDPFMDSLFKYKLVETGDLQLMDKAELYAALDKGPAQMVSGTEEEKAVYRNNVKWLKADIDKQDADRYFVLSMDMFQQQHPIINIPESTVYKYFTTIFWLDRDLNILTCSELSYD